MAPMPRGGDDTLFAAVDAEVDAASVSSRRGQLRPAANALRRAFDLASSRSGDGAAGALAARVARAAIGVQYCALLSRFGRHNEALNEALAAASETEEVWQTILNAEEARSLAAKNGDLPLKMNDAPLALLLREPPRWLERAAIASVQARHCVALELEFTMQDKDVTQDPEFDQEARWEMIHALHREGAWLAARLLPHHHGMRAQSERAEAQAVRRRKEMGNRHEKPPEIEAKTPFWDDGKRQHNLPEPGSDFWDGYEDGKSIEEQRLATHSSPAHPQSSGTRSAQNRRPASAPAGEALTRVADDLDVAERFTSQRPNSSPSGRPQSAAAHKQRRGRSAGRPGPAGLFGQGETSKADKQDIFAEWLQGAGLDRQSEVHRRLNTSRGCRELQQEMRKESFTFKHVVLPCYTNEEIWQNSKRFSPYGLHIWRQAEKQRQAERPSSASSLLQQGSLALVGNGSSRPTSAVRDNRARGGRISGCPKDGKASAAGGAACVRDLHKVLQRSFVNTGVQCGFIKQDDKDDQTRRTFARRTSNPTTHSLLDLIRSKIDAA